MGRLKKILISTAILVSLIVVVALKMDIELLQTLGISQDDDYTSEYILVLDREDKSIEYKKNHKSKAYPASLTKIMTTIVAIENIEDMSKVAPVDVDSYKKMVENNASMAGFYGKEAVTYGDLLYGTILSSGGEAANSLAINISGSRDKFVELMNKKAQELELKNTHFTNAEGLQDDRQYTTAYDMAKLLDYALDNRDFKAIFTKKTFKTSATLDHPDGIQLHSTVLSNLEDIEQKGFEIIGGKSGTTEKAGECWATLGVKDGREYICIVMGAPIDDVSNPTMKQREDSIELFKSIK